MASILGHALGGVVAARAFSDDEKKGLYYSKVFTVSIIVLSVLPDLDIIVWILLKPAGMTPHRGASHSLMFALIFAFIGWLIVSKGGKRGGWRLPLAFLAASLMHPLLDFLMGCGPKVPFFWPFTKTGYLSSVQLIPTAYYSKSIKGLIGLLIFHKESQIGIIFELMIFVPLLIAENKKAVGIRLWGPCLVLSALSVVVVYLGYN
jgi:membrane-bound metal-dependent hydrolase YbcI (DUF457 family)